jgi:PAS domain S-box-containing protein
MTTEALEARFRVLVDAVPDAVVVHIDGTIVFVNVAGVRLFGCERPEDLVGRPIVTLIPPDDFPAIMERIRRVAETGAAAEPRVERLLRMDGEPVDVRVRAIPVTWDGAPAILAFGQDLTEVRAYEERLAMADRLASVGTLAAGMAHDLNNPLAHLVLALDLALTASRGPTPLAAEDVAEIERRLEGALGAAERLRVIVDDLRVFARRPEVAEGPLRVDVPLHAAVGLAHLQLRHRCRFELDQSDPPHVQANEGRLVQVFLNLLVNALQALPQDRAPEENVVRVTCGRTAEGRAVVTVEDNGVGIAPEHMHRVFEPYFTTKPVGVGTGLGLWMVHGVVQRLGGEVRLDSTPAVGTRVTVELPPAEPVEVPARFEPRATEGWRILVVDDEPALAELVGDAFAPQHTVRVLTSGRDALAEIRAADPPWDLVVCDVMMPDLGGPELYRALEQDGLGAERRLVFATGGAFTERAQRFLSTVRVPVLHKPFRAAALQELLERSAAHAPRHHT